MSERVKYKIAMSSVDANQCTADWFKAEYQDIANAMESMECGAYFRVVFEPGENHQGCRRMLAGLRAYKKTLAQKAFHVQVVSEYYNDRLPRERRYEYMRIKRLIKPYGNKT